MKNTGFVALLISLALAGCSPGQSGGGGGGFKITGYAAPLSDGEFNSLSAEQQYQVVNKLLATVYKGMPVDEFFDVRAGFSNPQVRFDNGLSRIRTALLTDLSAAQRAAIDNAIDGIDREGNPNPQLAIYQFDGDERPRALPLARIHEYPVSRDGFVAWMAYFLSNTIMFSPALEMESTDIVNVQNIYRRLVTGIGSGQSVRQVVRGHLPTVDRWRVSRSAENHALEAYELYLGLFDTEVDSYRGGIACKDLYLTDADDGYQLTRTDFPNSEEQLILENYYIMDCDDLHDVIAGHPLLLPRVTEVIINYLMDGRTISDRLAMVESIVGSGAETFEEIFSAIIFSREYLLNTERPKSFEENLMALLDTVHWDVRAAANPVDDDIFSDMTSNNNSRLFLDAMGWNSMSLKIGRTPFVPMDAQSFGNYHKAVRESVLRLERTFQGRSVNVDVEDPDTGDIQEQTVVVRGLTRDDDGNGDIVLLPDLQDVSPEDYLHYLFLTAMQRRALPVEITDLLAIFGPGDLNWIRDIDNDGDLDVSTNNGRDLDVAVETFDYLTRLPEFYYFKNIN